MVLIGDLEMADRSLRHYRSISCDEDFRQEDSMAKTMVKDSVPPRWYGTAKDQRNVFYKRQYSTRTCYFNYTDKPINIIERSGLPMVYLPESRKDSANRIGIVLRHEVFFDNSDAALRTLHGFSQMTPLQGESAIQTQIELSRLLRNEIRHMTSYGATISTEYFVSLAELETSAEGYLYHHATDVLLSLRSVADTPRHPASSEYTEYLTRTLLSAPPLGRNDVTFILRYVTDDFHATPKYVQVAGKILVLKPEQGHPSKLTEVTLRDKRTEAVEEMCSEYIEVIYSAHVDSHDPNATGMRIRRIGLDEARTTYGVFDSYQEIASQKDIFEAQLRRLKEKNDQLSLELQREKREAEEKVKLVQRTCDDKLREKDLELSALQHELDQLKQHKELQLEQVREVREQQVHKQKVKFEFTKFLINIVTVVVGFLPALFKIFGARTALAK
jgi:hypothetical protein